jgi:alpha-L-rhamnosidase
MFSIATPIFPKGRNNDYNVIATFKANGDLRGSTLSICAADFYHVYVNGEFVAYGPARTAKGYGRVDIFDLDVFANGEDEIRICVLGHNCRGFSQVKQPSYLCAEIVKENDVILATGRDFSAFVSDTRIQKVERISFQRHFSEVCDLTCGTLITEEKEPVEVEEIYPSPKFIDRVVPYAVFNDVDLEAAVTVGDLSENDDESDMIHFYSKPIDEHWGFFPDEEVKHHPYQWMHHTDQTVRSRGDKLPITLSAGEYAFFDFGVIQTGMIKFSAFSELDSDIVIGYSEDSEPEKFAFTDIRTHTALEYFTRGGTDVDVVAFEPASIRYIMVACRAGKITLSELGVKTYVRDVSMVEIPELPNETLELIYRAAVRTFAHNAIDFYMDCSGRERSGWLCDSYFTAQTEYELFGDVPVEDAFLENYRLFENDGGYPEGMLPMCYPSEQQHQYGDGYIPQWSLWYFIEVDDYVNKRGRLADKELFRKSIYDLVKYFEKYENEDGLLESLPSWNFVEWGIANKWTQDVSYPTNFLYARALDAVYSLFGDEACREKAGRIRATAVSQSYNGEYFHDHAIRVDGRLVLQKDASEACQYYAILFGGIDLNDEKYRPLYRLVREVFKPDRNGAMPEIAEVDAFIGAYLRIEALLKLKEYEILLRDVSGFFGDMARCTGTLWEYRRKHGSRNHGFASFVIVAMHRALGIN